MMRLIKTEFALMLIGIGLAMLTKVETFVPPKPPIPASTAIASLTVGVILLGLNHRLRSSRDRSGDGGKKIADDTTDGEI